MVRRLTALVALVAAATAVSAALGANPRAEKERLNTADMALARRAALSLDDLDPAWRRIAIPATDETFTCPGFNPDFSAFTITGKARSAFSRGTAGSILSAVDVLATRSQAVADFRLGTKPALARCLRYATEQGFANAGPGVSARVVSSSVVPAPRVGERRVGVRLVARFAAGGRTLPLYVDVLVVQRGRSIAVLMFTGLAERISGQTALARAVAARLR